MAEHPTMWARAVEDRRWTTVLLALLCIALLAWTFRQAVGGELFRLQGLQVVGVAVEDVDLIRAYASAPLGRYIWRIDVQRVAQRVRLIPWAREVRVQRQWPDRLKVYVRRDASVAQALVDGQLIDVSAKGRMHVVISRQSHGGRIDIKSSFVKGFD